MQRQIECEVNDLLEIVNCPYENERRDPEKERDILLISISDIQCVKRVGVREK